MESLIALFREMATLFALESQFEAVQLRRRLLAGVLLFSFGFAIVFFLSIAVFSALVAMGIPVWVVALSFAGAFAVAALATYLLLGRRPTAAGVPFEGTRQEVNAFLDWFQSFVKKM